MPCVRIAVAGLAAWLVFETSPANAQNCAFQDLPNEHILNTTTRSYAIRIESTNSGSLSGKLQAELIAAIDLATSEWNENANDRAFQFSTSGLTVNRPLDDIPLTKAACDAEGINFSLVRVVPNINGAIGTFAKRCVDGSNVGHQFTISVGISSSNVVTQWIDTPFQTTGQDLVGIITHEFGHAVQLDHPTSVAVNATMSSPGATAGAARSLHQYDLECLASSPRGIDRQLAVFQRRKTTAGWSAEAAVTTSSAKQLFATDVSVGVNVSLLGSFIPSLALHDTAYGWAPHISGVAPNSFVTSVTNSIGPTNTILREGNQLEQRVYFGSFLDTPTAYAATSFHQLHYRRSTNEFATSTPVGPVQTCSAMSAWFMCLAETPVRVYDGVSVGFLDKAFAQHPSGVSVFAWANGDRTQATSNTDRELHVAIGEIDQNSLPQPDELGLYSSRQPAVACLNAAPYDCVIAFVDALDPLNTVRVRRFNVSQGTNRYVIGTEPGQPYSIPDGAGGTLRSGSRLAMFVQNGFFYLAAREPKAGSPISAFFSADGANWTFAVQVSASTVTGPTTMANYRESTLGNYFAYLR